MKIIYTYSAQCNYLQSTEIVGKSRKEALVGKTKIIGLINLEFQKITIVLKPLVFEFPKNPKTKIIEIISIEEIQFKKLNIRVLTNICSFYRIRKEIDWLMMQYLWKHDITSIFHDQVKDVMVLTSIQSFYRIEKEINWLMMTRKNRFC